MKTEILIIFRNSRTIHVITDFLTKKRKKKRNPRDL
jgi:hypothetical protein